jgi:hypothetical protein
MRISYQYKVPITFKNNLMKKHDFSFAKIKIWVSAFSITFVNAQNVDINLLRDNLSRNKSLDQLLNLLPIVRLGEWNSYSLFTVGLIKRQHY